MIARPKTLARCPWASDDLAIYYHDEEWGVPVLMTARSLNSSFWKERSLCKTTAPITFRKRRIRGDGTSICNPGDALQRPDGLGSVEDRVLSGDSPKHSPTRITKPVELRFALAYAAGRSGLGRA